MQILLAPEQYERLQAAADVRSCSVALVVREAIDRYLDQGEGARRTAASTFLAWSQDDEPVDWEQEKRVLSQSAERVGP